MEDGSEYRSTDNSFLEMMRPYGYSRGYYGSYPFYYPVPVVPPGINTAGMGQSVHPNTSTASDHSESAAKEDEQSRAVESGTKGKSSKKQAPKYESFQPEEQKYLVNLWVSYHERLESKDARKYWSKIVEELNAKYHHDRTAEKCKRKMKYLVDKYKERKDWNRKQSGGSIWKSPHYDEIDGVLGVRDVVTFDSVAEAGSETPSTSQVDSSSSSTPSPGTAASSSAASEKESRRIRKNRKSSTDAGPDDSEIETGKMLKTVTEQGDRITGVMERMQEAQTKQMDMMTKFMGAMLERMEKDK